jgi:hypothetical protein
MFLPGVSRQSVIHTHEHPPSSPRTDDFMLDNFKVITFLLPECKDSTPVRGAPYEPPALF